MWHLCQHTSTFESSAPLAPHGSAWISEMMPHGPIIGSHVAPYQHANQAKISFNHTYQIQTLDLPGDKLMTYNFYRCFGVEWYAEDNLFKL